MASFRKVLRALSCSFLLMMGGSFLCALLTLLNAYASALTRPDTPGVILLIFMGLALFAVVNLWPLILFFGAWLAWLPPRRTSSWLLLIIFSLIAGLIISWIVQAGRLSDFHPGSDVGLPEWESFDLFSVTTMISCLGVVTTTSLMNLALTSKPAVNR